MRYRYVLLMVFVMLAQPAPAHDALIISTSYQNLLSNSDHSGFLDRMLGEVFSRLGIPCEFVYSPTDRSVVDVNAGLLDAEINRIRGFEELYPNLVRVPEPNMIMEFVAFSRRDYDLQSWSDLEGLYVGHVAGWLILEEATSGFANVVHVPSEVELFRMLDKDRIDVALYARLTGLVLLSQLGIENVTPLTPPLARREMFLYVHERHEGLVESIAEAIRLVKSDGTYEEILREVLAEHGIADGPGE